MRERADQIGRRVRRQHRVGVERDHVAHAPDHGEVALDDREGVSRATQHELVELGELAALALPAHPHALPRIPAAGAMEEIEGVVPAFRVPRVERPDALDRGVENRLIPLAVLGRGVGEVAQHREVEVRLPVGQELHLEVVERLPDRVHVREERGDDDRRAELRRNPVLVQVELGQGAGRQEGRDQLVHDVDRDVVGGDEPEEQDGQPHRPGRRAAQQRSAASAAQVSETTPPTNTTLGCRRTQRCTASAGGGR